MIFLGTLSLLFLFFQTRQKCFLLGSSVAALAALAAGA